VCFVKIIKILSGFEELLEMLMLGAHNEHKLRTLCVYLDEFRREFT